MGFLVQEKQNNLCYDFSGDAWIVENDPSQMISEVHTPENAGDHTKIGPTISVASTKSHTTEGARAEYSLSKREAASKNMDSVDNVARMWSPRPIFHGRMRELDELRKHLISFGVTESVQQSCGFQVPDVKSDAMALPGRTFFFLTEMLCFLSSISFAIDQKDEGMGSKVIVSGMHEGGYAEQCGFIQPNDILTSIDGEEVAGCENPMERIAEILHHSSEVDYLLLSLTFQRGANETFTVGGPRRSSSQVKGSNTELRDIPFWSLVRGSLLRQLQFMTNESEGLHEPGPVHAGKDVGIDHQKSCQSLCISGKDIDNVTTMRREMQDIVQSLETRMQTEMLDTFEHIGVKVDELQNEIEYRLREAAELRQTQELDWPACSENCTSSCEGSCDSFFCPERMSRDSARRNVVALIECSLSSLADCYFLIPEARLINNSSFGLPIPITHERTQQSPARRKKMESENQIHEDEELQKRLDSAPCNHAKSMNQDAKSMNQDAGSGVLSLSCENSDYFILGEMMCFLSSISFALDQHAASDSRVIVSGVHEGGYAELCGLIQQNDILTSIDEVALTGCENPMERIAETLHRSSEMDNLLLTLTFDRNGRIFSIAGPRVAFGRTKSSPMRWSAEESAKKCGCGRESDSLDFQDFPVPQGAFVPEIW